MRAWESRRSQSAIEDVDDDEGREEEVVAVVAPVVSSSDASDSDARTNDCDPPSAGLGSAPLTIDQSDFDLRKSRMVKAQLV